MSTPFDLHVLSTPPAFILSQDQTLNKMVSKRFRVQIILLKLNLSFIEIEQLLPHKHPLTFVKDNHFVLLVLRVFLHVV